MYSIQSKPAPMAWMASRMACSCFSCQLAGASQEVAIIRRNAGLALCNHEASGMADLPHLRGPGCGIGSAQGHKLCMGSRFYHPPLVQNMNDVGVHGGGEAVGDHERRPARGEGAETAQPVLLRPGIHGAGGFVQDDQRGPPAESPGQGNALPFAPAQFRASKPLAQQSLEAILEAFDRLE